MAEETKTASETIAAEVTSWPGVVARPEDRGELAFKVGRREIGHLHGDAAAHFSFPKRVWAELRDQGRIVHHPVFPDRQGPAARSIRDEDDVRDVIELLRLNYDRLRARAAGDSATRPDRNRGDEFGHREASTPLTSDSTRRRLASCAASSSTRS
jgi:hypothetical protein